MQLDSSKCPVGTVGWLQLLSCADLMDGDFDWVKEPSVVLDESRQWVAIEPRTQPEWFPDSPPAKQVVFSSWQAAVRDVIERDRKDARELLDEANKLMDEATSVERMLKAELVQEVAKL